MNTLRTLMTASVALVASMAGASLASAMTADHGEGAYHGATGRIDHGAWPAGRSRFRDDGHGGPFDRWAGGRRHWRRFGYLDFGYPYGGDGFDGGYAADYGPANFGPEPPYGPGMGYPPIARPMAPALAPSAYGPGVHDGAYAYGYNGYAQTPALGPGFSGMGWSTRLDGRGCGC